MGKVNDRLKRANIVLPNAPVPQANYVPYVISGNQVFVSGQVPFVENKRQFIGKVGQQFNLKQAQECARIVGLNLLAQVKSACEGNLDRVRRCVKLGGFVNCTPDFTEHPQVINAASDLMVEVFGEAGRHSRFAVGAPSLPFDVAVEIEGIFEIA